MLGAWSRGLAGLSLLGLDEFVNCRLDAEGLGVSARIPI